MRTRAKPPPSTGGDLDARRCPRAQARARIESRAMRPPLPWPAALLSLAVAACSGSSSAPPPDDATAVIGGTSEPARPIAP